MTRTLRTALASLFALSLFLTGCGESPPPSSADASAPGRLEICFPFCLQEGPDANQFALWVETGSGEFVTTLFVTEFAARGGCAQHSELLPGWAEMSGGSPPDSVDAAAGATPDAQELTYSWDCVKGGSPVSPGTYRFFIEANTGQGKRALFSGSFEVGGGEQLIDAQASYFGEESGLNGMISFVQARYQPASEGKELV